MINYGQYGTRMYRYNAQKQQKRRSNAFICDKYINIYTGLNKTRKDGFYQNG